MGWVTVRNDLGPTGNFVGGGRNKKTAAQPQYSPSRSSPAQNYTRQAEQYTRQAPEPFRNPARAANPRGVESQQLNDKYARPAQGLMLGDWRRAQPQREPHSQEEINAATGHERNYEPAGQAQVVGVQRRQPRSGDINLPGGPRAKKPGDSGRPNPPSWSAANAPAAKMRTNLDLFGPGLESFRRRDGGRGSVL
jgi:hypothetical protein